MDLFLSKNYAAQNQQGKLAYPGAEVTEMDKHCLAMAEFIYGAYCNNKTSFLLGGGLRGRSMSELRAYARGMQSTSKYDEWFDPVDENGEVHVNISRDIVQILPKFRDRIKGKFEEVNFDFNVIATDPTARKERELKRAKRKIAARPEMKALIQMSGVKPTDLQEDESIRSDRDADLLYKLGGERLNYEVLMRAAISSVEYESQWDDELKDRIIDDLIDLGAFSTWSYVEKATRKIKEKYVDPERVIIQKTQHNNHMGATYGGIIEDYTIARLRMESDLDENTLKQIAKKYIDFPHNKGMAQQAATSMNSFRDDNYKDLQHSPWSQLNCQVLSFCFVAGETEKYIMGRHHRYGNSIFDKVNSDAELSRRDEKRGKSFMSNTIQYVYTGKWIVGTKFVFDCQKEYGTVRAGSKGFKEAVIPLHVYVMDSPSMVERCIGFVDDIQLATLKKRNTLAKIPPAPRMVIDISKLHDSVKIGGQEYSTLDLVRAFPKEGILIVKSKGEFDYLNQGAANGNPIQFMDSGAIQDIQLFINEVIDGINKIKMVTGIEDAVDMSQTPDLLVGVMKGVEAQTNTSLRPLFKAYKIMNIACRVYWMLKYQVLLSSGDIDITYTPIGSNTIEAATLTSDLTAYDFGLQVEVLPSNEERVMMMQYLIGQRDTGTIDPVDFFIIKQLIDNNQIKLAQVYLVKAIDEKQQRMQQMELQKIQANGEANSQPIIQEAEMAMKKAQLQSALDMKLEEKKAQMQDWINEQQFNREQMKAGVEMGERIASAEAAA